MYVILLCFQGGCTGPYVVSFGSLLFVMGSAPSAQLTSFQTVLPTTPRVMLLGGVHRSVCGLLWFTSLRYGFRSKRSTHKLPDCHEGGSTRWGPRECTKRDDPEPPRTKSAPISGYLSLDTITIFLVYRGSIRSSPTEG